MPKETGAGSNPYTVASRKMVNALMMAIVRFRDNKRIS